jgi:hypothetical protein
MTTITEEADLSSSLEQKIKLATEGFIDHFVNLLRKQSEHNMEIICDYILAMNTEVNRYLHIRGIKCKYFVIYLNIVSKHLLSK